MFRLAITICSFLFLCNTLELEGGWSYGGTPRTVRTINNDWPVSYTYGDKTNCQLTFFGHIQNIDNSIGINQLAINQNQSKIDDLTKQIKTLCPDFNPMLTCANQSVQPQVSSLYAQMLPLQKEINSWNENIKKLNIARADDNGAFKLCI